MWFSVITVNYNVRDFLANAIESIQKSLDRLPPDSDGERGEITIVDNASDDGSVDLIRSRYPRLRMIQNRRNLGFGRANNVAMREARGKYILLINPDTIVQEDTLPVMLEFLETYRDVGVAGCKVLNVDGTLQAGCRRSFPTPWVAFARLSGLSTLFHNSRLFGRYNLTYLPADEVHEVDAVSGAFMVLRRETYERVGGFDEEFFMYGEDLDLCRRVKADGWRVMYVPKTQIIHFKGESTKRSNIDEIAYFYDAMRVYVQKHHSGSVIGRLLLNAAIECRTFAARLGRLTAKFKYALFDLVLIDGSVLLAELLWHGRVGKFPGFVYPLVLTIPALLFIILMYSGRASPTKPLSVSRSGGAAVLTFLLIFALTAIFKQYAFSRAVLLLGVLFSLVAVPGWRIALRLTGRSRRVSLFGRRTLIVGVGASGQEVLRRLKNHHENLYDIVGFIDVNRQRLGEEVEGIPILGSVETIGKVIGENRVTDVIFSTGELAFEEILSVIGKTKNPAVNFSLVPTTREVIIGKWGVDTLEEVPLVEIEYNIGLASHRWVKRLFDVALGLALSVVLYPFVRLVAGRRPASPLALVILQAPLVLAGTRSWVGPPATARFPADEEGAEGIYIGKPGVLGPVQLFSNATLSAEDERKLILSYAKNQSFSLDIEILVRSLTGLQGRDAWLGYRR